MADQAAAAGVQALAEPPAVSFAERLAVATAAPLAEVSVVPLAVVVDAPPAEVSAEPPAVADALAVEPVVSPAVARPPERPVLAPAGRSVLDVDVEPAEAARVSETHQDAMMPVQIVPPKPMKQY